jgi:hypothetical protein
VRRTVPVGLPGGALHARVRAAQTGNLSWREDGGSGWESNPPRLALRDPPPILKTGETTGPQPPPAWYKNTRHLWNRQVPALGNAWHGVLRRGLWSVGTLRQALSRLDTYATLG